MKVLVAIAVAVAFVGFSNADEDAKTKSVNFYRCVACSEEVRTEYMKCDDELRPQKNRKVAQDCKKQLMPEAESPEDEWKIDCANEEMEGKIYDCIVAYPDREELNDDEKAQMEKFRKCRDKVNEDYCQNN